MKGFKKPQNRPSTNLRISQDLLVMQNLKLRRSCSSRHQTDNRQRFSKKYYSLRGKNLPELPDGYEGEFGPGIKALVISLYYGSMTQSKFLEFLGDIGISMSAGYLSNLLIKTTRTFILRK